MIYRPDIQILRGIAVLFVVLYHLEIPGFHNGYLGVDIFFTLSGYLMALLYHKSSPLEFCVRRLKRILPAYMVTIGLTTFAVGMIAVPSDANQRFDRLWFDLFGLSNFAFWLENSYFDRAVFKPLLNLWSLGVELQYYLIVPLLLPFLRDRRLLLFFMIAGSISASFLLLTISPKTSFFLLPFRIWEFLVGAGFAWKICQKDEVRWGFTWLSLLSLLIFSILLLPIDTDSRSILYGHPGMAALIVVAITGVLLYRPLQESLYQANWVARVVGKLGDYSYSIYLVHFPVIVLLGYQPFGGTLRVYNKTAFEFGFNFEDGTFVFGALFLTILVSVMMFHFVESIRKKRNFRNSFISLSIITATLAISGIVINQKKYDADSQIIFGAWQDRDPYRCGIPFRLFNPFQNICNLSSGSGETSILLIGDSHADSIKGSFEARLSKSGIGTLFYVPNDPVFGPDVTPDKVLADCLKLGVKDVVLHFSPGIYKHREYRYKLLKLVELLNKNAIGVVIVAPVPTFSTHIPKLMWNKKMNLEGQSTSTEDFATPLLSMSDFELRNQMFFSFLRDAKVPSEHVVFPHEKLCSRNEGCIYQLAGKPLYFDQTHLTLTGAKILEPLFDTVAQTLIRKSNGE